MTFHFCRHQLGRQPVDPPRRQLLPWHALHAEADVRRQPDQLDWKRNFSICREVIRYFVVEVTYPTFYLCLDIHNGIVIRLRLVIRI